MRSRAASKFGPHRNRQNLYKLENRSAAHLIPTYPLGSDFIPWFPWRPVHWPPRDCAGPYSDRPYGATPIAVALWC